MSTESEREEKTEIKVMIAFDNEYRAYQGALSAAIRILRPDAEVMTVEPEKLGAVAKRFCPDIVIGSRFEDDDLDDARAWIELALNPTQATRVLVHGEYAEITNPTLDKLLVIIEEVAQRKPTGGIGGYQWPI